jgi:hypothetical protein
VDYLAMRMELARSKLDDLKTLQRQEKSGPAEARLSERTVATIEPHMYFEFRCERPRCLAVLPPDIQFRGCALIRSGLPPAFRLRAQPGAAITSDTVGRSPLPSSPRRSRPLTHITETYANHREGILPVMNTAATNTLDSALKRVRILNETIRAFATRVLPLRLFSTFCSNVPLQGTDEAVVSYYPLQTASNSTMTSTSIPAYVFGQATSTGMKKITVSSRKYQPLDYSSQEFCR